MKKTVALALSLVAIGSMSAQKQVVDQASKTKDLSEARTLFQQAMANPETQNDARTWYLAGKAELDAYDNALKLQLLDPSKADPAAMGEELINAYNYFLKALPLDSLPDAKGKVKPKYSKDIVNKLSGHVNDFFNAGGQLYNAKKYYPDAYNAFMIFGDITDVPAFAALKESVPQPQVATSYFNAGLAAYTGNAVDESAKAFRKARLNNYSEPEAYIYEIACWQYISSNDSTRVGEAQKNIREIAEAGYNKFGVAQPIFLNNLVNILVTDNKYDDAISLVKKELASNPDNANLYGLEGFIYDRKGEDALSEVAYRKAASIETADYETLVNAAKKIFRIGTEKWNLIEGNSAEDNAKRQDMKTNYFEASKAIAEKAKSIKGDRNDGTLDYLLDSIDYTLTTYFNR